MSIWFPSPTKLTDFFANLIGVEKPSCWAFSAFSVELSFASWVSWINQIYGNALTIDNWRSLITLLADSNLSIEIFALRFYFAANSICIEIIMVRALGTNSIVPCFTTKIIIEYFNKFWIFELIPQFVSCWLTPDQSKNTEKNNSSQISHSMLIYIIMTKIFTRINIFSGLINYYKTPIFSALSFLGLESIYNTPKYWMQKLYRFKVEF